MSLSDIVNVTITAQTQTVSRQGFGVPMIARNHNVIPDRVREYRSVKAMTDDSWPTTDPAVLMATLLSSQNPRPPSWKVGKRDSAFTQTIRITPINTTEGFVYDLGTINGTAVTYTVGAAATVAIIVTALQALIDAISGVTATDDTTHVTVATDTAGALVDYVGASLSPDDWSFKDVTTDPGIAADLTLIEAADSDGWYFLLLDSQSEAEVLAAAAWIEARKKILLANNSDTDIVDSGSSTDLCSDLQAAAYARTGVLYSQAKLLSWSATAWVGKQAPTDPGSSTWAFKTLAGVTVDTKLTDSHISTIETSKNGNTYRVIGGVNVTFEGKVAEGEWIDIVRGIDWLDVRIQESVFALFVNNPKVPYTDAGIDLIRAEILARLEDAVDAGLLAGPIPEDAVQVPLASEVDAADKGNRRLPDVFFKGTLAGAIHGTDIEGVLSL